MAIATPDHSHFATQDGGQRPRPFPIRQTGTDGQVLLSAPENLCKKEPYLLDRGKVELTLAPNPEKRITEKKIFWR